MRDAELMSQDDRRRLVQGFVERRGWQRFDKPHHLILALVGEVGELAAVFQWLTPQDADTVMQDPAAAASVREELADVAIYLERLAAALGVDLDAAVRWKMERNEARFPVPAARRERP